MAADVNTSSAARQTVRRALAGSSNCAASIRSRSSIVEATGGLQRPLAVALVDAGIPVAIINPSRIRHYALAEGLIAKTDKVDARIIALFALKIVPQPTAVRNALEELSRLRGRRKRNSSPVQGGRAQSAAAEANRLGAEES